MSLLSRLFGSKDSVASEAPAAASEEYAGYRVTPEPVADGGKWRIGARIEREVEGQMRSHMMIRADTLESQDAAVEASLAKARMLIDQQGDRIFD
jgi:hypothetical protein